MGQKNIAFAAVATAFVIGVSSVSAAPKAGNNALADKAARAAFEQSKSAESPAALKKATGPFGPILVDPVILAPKKTRDLLDLYDEDLFTRDFEEKLHARAARIFRGTGNAILNVVNAQSNFVETIADKIKDVTQPKDKSKPLDPVAAGAATTKKVSKKKRTRDLSDFEEELFTRALEEELNARGWLGLEDLD